MSKKLLSLDELTKEAQEVFAANPDVTKVYATADNNVFLPTSENAARNHARQEKLELHTISRTTDASEEAEDEDGE